MELVGWEGIRWGVEMGYVCDVVESMVVVNALVLRV